MKKQLPFILIVIAAIGIGYSFINKPADSGMGTTVVTPGNSITPAAQGGSNNGQPANGGQSGVSVGETGPDVEDALDEMQDIKPAAIAYKDANEALEAIKKGSVDYDDTILEQFTQPGEDCTWCPEMYKSIKDMLKSSEYKNEQKSFYAEILAISGKVENIESIVDGFKAAGSPEEKEVYSSALELTTGKDDVVQYLGTQLKTENSELKESVVAAVTNQGSPLALDTLYKHTVENGDPDGYYSMGVGIGEMILDPSALSKAQELAQKRDAYSPLLVKALLNSGIDGLRIVMDILGNSTDVESNKRLLKDAVDHVSYDDQIEAYLKEQANSSNPSVSGFAKQTLDDFSNQEDNTEEEEGGQSSASTTAP